MLVFIWQWHRANSFSVCIASLVRIYFMTFLKTSIDITWIMGDVFIWSSVEPCVGILCACLPTIRPLLRLAFQRLWGSLNAERTPGPSNSNSNVSEDCFQRPVSIGPCSPLEERLFPEDREISLVKSVTHVEIVGSFHDGTSDGFRSRSTFYQGQKRSSGGRWSTAKQTSDYQIQLWEEMYFAFIQRWVRVSVFCHHRGGVLLY